ncbi:hypothetical protein [Akkermansia muciniphila]|nr:hypothetical protein [Akkermansia muciniphila]
MLKNTNQPFNWKANNTSSNLYQHYYGVQADEPRRDVMESVQQGLP